MKAAKSYPPQPPPSLMTKNTTINSNTSRSSPRTKRVNTAPYACHVMGYQGHIPGSYYSVGMNVRTWMDKIKVEKENGKDLGSTMDTVGSPWSGSNSSGASTVRTSASVAAAATEGIRSPIVGYTGHVSGLMHCSKNMLGSTYHEAVKQCWDEAAPLHDLFRSTPPVIGGGVESDNASRSSRSTYLKYGTCVPPQTHRGWRAFQTTSRHDYPDHSSRGLSVDSSGTFYPELRTATTPQERKDPFSAQTPESSHSSQRSQRPKTAPSRSSSAVAAAASLKEWIPEDSPLPRRTDNEVLALVRTKVRSRVSSMGELRLAFHHFSQANSNVISFDKWVSGLVMYGMNHFLRLSEAQAAFTLADKNRDGVIDMSEFVTSVMGRSRVVIENEHDGFHTERAISTSTKGVRLN